MMIQSILPRQKLKPIAKSSFSQVYVQDIVCWILQKEHGIYTDLFSKADFQRRICSKS